MCQTALYPGTFDPVTNGHIDLILRAHEIFHDVIVAVAHNPHKKPVFSVKERVSMLKEATKGMDGVTVTHFDCLVVDFAHKIKAKVL
ncbi:MAG: adenylyltransferase/cytidyltransferase family protein, partial [Candidatus Omnitrophota bacterium]